MLVNCTKTNLIDLNAECFQSLTKFLSHRDIIALSFASRLWLKDVPLLYDDIADYRQSDIVAFMENCGIYLRSFIVAKPDNRVYQMHQLLVNCCPHIESINEVLSELNEYGEYSFTLLKHLLNLKNLVIKAPYFDRNMSEKAALHLSELKCLPRLQVLKIHWTPKHSVDLSESIRHCQRLKILHIYAYTSLKADALQHCKNLEELYIADPEEDDYETQCGKANWCPWEFYAAFYKLRKIRKLYLKSATCLSVFNVQAIAQLPHLQHLTLQNFTLCQRHLVAWSSSCALPKGALAKLEVLHFVRISYVDFSFDNMLLYLVRTCRKLRYIRLREIQMFEYDLLNNICGLMARKRKVVSNIGPRLTVVVEDFKKHTYVLKQSYNRLAKKGILKIKFVNL